MAKKEISFEIMEYMVWVVEITARHYFDNDKGTAYKALHECGIWDLYIEHYDVTHTLGAEVIIDEINNALANGKR